MNTSVRMNPVAKKTLAFLALLAILVGTFPVSALAVVDESENQPQLGVLGCTDPAATNYNPSANSPDNSCVYAPAPVSGCTNVEATNYNSLATIDDDSCVIDVPTFQYCTDDAALNYEEEGECIYDDGREVITACKYSSTEEPIEGWGITITNGKEGEDEVTSDDLLTEEDGCVSASVYPEDGPFTVVEEDREGWTQESVFSTFGQVLGEEGLEYCQFFDQNVSFSDKDLDNQTFTTNIAIINPEYRCEFFNQEPEEPEEPEEPNKIINTCLVPNTLGDVSEFSMNNSGEKTVAQMLADHGYVAVDTTNDQINYQVWDLVDPTADTITFNVKVLGKRAGNTQILGYYKAGDGSTFTSVLTQVSDTDGEVVVPVTIPAIFATSFGFGIKSDDMTWFSEKSLNSDAKDHVAVYNPASNTYLLAFEDFNNLGDGDYNDLVIEVAGVKCVPPPPPVDLCNNIDGIQVSVPEGMERSEAGSCAIPEVPQEVINTCLVPNTLGDVSEFSMNNSGEKTVAQMLADHGYVAVDTTNDQINYQVWDLVDPTADTITFNVKVLGKRAGNTQILGYYKAGDGSTFTSVLTQVSDTDGEVVVPVTIPAIFATSFGFGIKSDDMTWFSEKSLNSDAKDHVAVYNPASNTYLLAFEDFNNLGDGDYNDLVIEVAGVKCVQDGQEEITTNGGGNSSGGGGRRAVPTVAGDSISAPEPTPLVLGEQVTAVPYGAPATGHGGSSTNNNQTYLGLILSIIVTGLALKRREVTVTT